MIVTIALEMMNHLFKQSPERSQGITSWRDESIALVLTLLYCVAPCVSPEWGARHRRLRHQFQNGTITAPLSLRYALENDGAGNEQSDDV